MKDIIWTVIILWIVWKIYDAFKSVTKPKTQTNSNSYYSNQNSNHQSYQTKKEGEVKVDINSTKQKAHFKPDDGEYVDYEEIK